MTRILLITVGGSHKPIITSVQSLKPDRTIFICSNGKRGSISQVTGEGKPCEVRQGSEVLEKLPNIPSQLNLGDKFNPETDVIAVDNPDDVSSIYLKISDCIHTLKQTEPKATLLADYTGGTKSMSVALALVALDEECELHLTTTSRTDLIRVTRGETVRRAATSDLTVRRLLTQEIPTLLAQYNYPAAIAELETCLRDLPLSHPQPVEQYLRLCRGLNHWDCFDHEEAWYDLEPFMNQAPLRPLLMYLKRVMASRQAIAPAMNTAFNAPDQIPGHGYELVEDLLFNAERRAALDRYDDAVGRLYRALELLAQTHLWLRYQIKTDDVEVEQIPPALRDQVQALKGRDGKIQLALRNSYELLKQWPADPLGALYQPAAERLFDQLQVRNYSILAHGLRPVTATDYKQRFQTVIIPFIEAGLKAVIGNQSRFDPVQFPSQITINKYNA
ncbi:TIGR02710 family CRISPR-associated CARF protein [Synechocystis salina]|uniref:TIGR02710 family CRISPR-associated protein n=1 Tax=Synechocystis salina LEGE 00031 TaxID=1828736 RepID=A0ABR9VU93_9SYNC|nr:TIGR02710 family CRISPR-associated CARF protein [Synechocystis salina]MBE9242213.1 TIGR02710 family CRISPR-associated protein [Synechocystis salina LEGE 00041]MBE9254463.1 TIGR02710 family CRISPR-associated protein [Synechocystis salina LEGE 00031]